MGAGASVNGLKKEIEFALNKCATETGFAITHTNFSFYKDGSFGIEVACQISLLECGVDYSRRCKEYGLPVAGTIFKNAKGQKYRIEGMFLDEKDEPMVVVMDVETARMTMINVYSVLYFLETYK